ncbi:MAG: hypothetical protein WCW67_04690 [Candidatus Margulisiibacteriota bacterium]
MKSKILILLVSLSIVLTGTSWANWVTQETGTTQNINSIYFASDTVGYAVGNAGVALKSVNGGTTWSNFAGMSASSFNDVFFPAVTEGYFLTTREAYQSNGTTVTEIGSTFAVASGTDFLRGSAYGARRSIVGYNAGTSPATSYLMTSDGAGWTTTDITNLILGTGFIVNGVFTTGEGVSIDTWLWGETLTGSHCAINFDTSTGTVRSVSYFAAVLNDLFFYDRLDGFIALADGTVSKTTTGGTGWTNVDPFSSASGSLNSVYFITKDFGWIAGDGGAIAYTTNGGTNWGIYDLSPSTNVQDIFVRLVYPGELAGVYAYMCGDGGMIYRLRSPSITALNPSTQYQGWIGTMEVTGVDFLPSAPGTNPLQSAFIKPGETAFDFNVDVRSTTFESSSRIILNVFIDPSSETGARDLLVANPDSTATRELNALNVVARTADVTISRVNINGNIYPEALSSSLPATTITSNPLIGFEINTSVGNQLSLAKIKCKVVARYNDGTDTVTVIEDVSADNITIDSTVFPPTRATVSGFRFNANLPTDGRAVTVFFYAEDDNAHVGIIRYDLYTESSGGSTAVEETRAITTPIEIDGSGNFYATVWTRNGTLPPRIEWIIVSGVTGQVLYRKTHSLLRVSGMGIMDVSTRADRVRLTASVSDLRHDKGAQIAKAYFFDPATGKKLTTSSMLLIPGSMLQHHVP